MRLRDLCVSLASSLAMEESLGILKLQNFILLIYDVNDGSLLSGAEKFQAPSNKDSAFLCSLPILTQES